MLYIDCIELQQKHWACCNAQLAFCLTAKRISMRCEIHVLHCAFLQERLFCDTNIKAHLHSLFLQNNMNSKCRSQNSLILMVYLLCSCSVHLGPEPFCGRGKLSVFVFSFWSICKCNADLILTLLSCLFCLFRCPHQLPTFLSFVFSML